MADPVDMIVPLLQQMRAENAARHEQSLEKFAAIERRLDKVVATQLSFGRASTADSLLTRPAAGKFGKRSRILERKARELESWT